MTDIKPLDPEERAILTEDLDRMDAQERYRSELRLLVAIFFKHPDEEKALAHWEAAETYPERSARRWLHDKLGDHYDSRVHAWRRSVEGMPLAVIRRTYPEWYVGKD